MTTWFAVWRLSVLGATVTGSLLVTPFVSAHSELVSSSPAAGDTITEAPSVITGAYSESLDPTGSSLVLVDQSGDPIARGGVVASAGNPKEMSIDPVPPLVPGVYTVRSKTKSTEDDDIDRTTWTFTVAAPTPSPTSGASASTAPGSEATRSPSSTSWPSASPAPGPTSEGGSDVFLPIIAALAIVAFGGSFLIARGRHGGRRP